MISKKLKIDFTDLKIENEVRSNCDNPVKINILGDWTPSTEKLGSFMIEKGENYYEDLLHYFHDSDLNVTNLETVIDNMDAGIESHGSRFINKKETLDSMKSIRMDLVCLANNHMMDNGEEGLRSTRKSLDEYSIQYIGAGFNDDEIYNPFLFDGKGIRIAIINAADGECANEKYNDNKGVADIDSFRIVDCIRKHKKEGCFVVLILHAGVEFSPVPPPFIRKSYRTFTEIGADIVVGHHPHVVQGVELYQNTPIIYSVGHFSLYRDNGREKEKQGLMLRLSIDKSGIADISFIPFNITKEKIEKLNSDQRDSFICNFQKISGYITQDKTVYDIWELYVYKRYPMISFSRIFGRYLYDEKHSAILSKNMFLSNSSKYLYTTHSIDVEMNFLYLKLLTEYGCIRHLSWYDTLFLKSGNLFRKVFLMSIFLHQIFRFFKKSILKIVRTYQ